LAATTERLSADADVQLPQEIVYGLLRAGLPSDKLLWRRLNRRWPNTRSRPYAMPASLNSTTSRSAI